MRILVSWLRELVDVRAPIPELAHTLSMRGFEPGEIEYLGEDAVVDVEITANRPDCMNMVGIAREVATAYNLPLRDIEIRSPSRGSTAPPLSITIEDPDLCPRYAAAVMDVKPAASPAWLTHRLAAAGVRPIGAIVDVTNYVMLALGQPMHAFDLDRLEGGELRIRRARAGERIRTLDGEPRDLTDSMLVIADARRPQAIGGVMGGHDSEIGSGTRRIALESACFNPISIRRTSKKLGLKTEASARFERGADIGAPVTALQYACMLLEQIGAGTIAGELIDRYPNERQPTRLVLRERSIGRHLGQPADRAEVVRILRSLGFAVSDAADGWTITVPTFRVDVLREIDLIEEIARHVGYDRLPETFPILREVPPSSDPRIDADNLARRLLTGAGFAEAVTFAFIETRAAAAFASAAETIPIAKPLSEKFAVLRPSLLPGLLESLGHNRRREQHTVRLFEIGRRFRAPGGETRSVAVAWAGAGGSEHWSAKPRPVDFFDARGVVQRLGEAFRVEAAFSELADGDEGAAFLAIGRRARVASPDSRPIGVVGQLSPLLVETFDLGRGDEVYVAEIDLDALAAAAPAEDLHVAPLPRFPSIARDISILVDQRLPAEHVRATILAAAPATLERVREFDRYRGKGIPDDKTSLSLRLTFRAADRTLTDAEVDEAMAAIVPALEKAHNAVRR